MGDREQGKLEEGIRLEEPENGCAEDTDDLSSKIRALEMDESPIIESFGQVLDKVQNLYKKVSSVYDGLNSLIEGSFHDGDCDDGRPVWTRGPNFLRAFRSQVRKEQSALQALWKEVKSLPTPELEERLLHRIRSTNLPHLEAVWNVFEHGGYSGVVSLGSGIKPESSGGYAGDLTAAYGESVVKISRVTVSQLKREIATIMLELADDEQQMSVEEIVSMTEVFRAVEKVVLDVKGSEYCHDALADSEGFLPRLLRPQRSMERAVTLLVYNIGEQDLLGVDGEIVRNFVSVISSSLKIDVRLFGDHTLSFENDRSAKEIIAAIMKEDHHHFLTQVPPMLNFDVTGGFCLISDITNLTPEEATRKLDWQRDNPPPSTSAPDELYQKSANAFQFLRNQIEAERQHRVLHHVLRPLVEGGERTLICSRQVRQKLIDMADRMGSAEEKRRARLIFLDIDARDGFTSSCGEWLDSIPKLRVIGPEVDQEKISSPNEAWIEEGVLRVALDYSRQTEKSVMHVTGNFKVAKQLAKKLEGSGWLIVNSRSLAGGF
ncbi:hypothetical protein BZA70DRAFT_143168 [Myxozyma melibiosi]|uniref:DUF1308 domain-containing protein n=1 Tax=Myxozyma melibiosi TaxID=54550 RepID=A0ABR1F9I2_9ASCO